MTDLPNLQRMISVTKPKYSDYEIVDIELSDYNVILVVEHNKDKTDLIYAKEWVVDWFRQNVVGFK